MKPNKAITATQRRADTKKTKIGAAISSRDIACYYDSLIELGYTEMFLEIANGIARAEKRAKR